MRPVTQHMANAPVIIRSTLSCESETELCVAYLLEHVSGGVARLGMLGLALSGRFLAQWTYAFFTSIHQETLRSWPS